jgi:O-antigen ligase
MFIFFTTGLVIMLDRDSNRWLRGSTLIFVPVAASLIWLSHSATTVLMMGATTAALLAHAFIWQPAARVAHMRMLIISFIVLIGLTAGLLLFGLLQFDAMDSLLAAFGKDSTLTGRTFIWDWGHRLMEENPWTGLGANGFWRSEIGVANQITTYFHYEQFVKFSFHNSFLENGVQFGYPGYYATYFIVAWALWNCGRTWLRNQTVLNAAMLIMTVMVVVRSNTEIDLATELGGTAILMFIGAIRKEDLRRPVEASAPQVPQAPVHANRRRGR